MIIQVTCPGGKETPEWVVLELQGKLLPATSLGREPLDGKLMGQLLPVPGGDPKKALLQLGSYRMTGSIVVLSKPLAVMQKRKRAADESGPGSSDATHTSMDEDISATASASSSSAHEDSAAVAGGRTDGKGTEYVIRAVVRKKFIFDDRPQPIVGTAGKSVASP